MNTKNAQFYFANLGADVMRCISAAQNKDDKKYDDSLARAGKTLSLLHKTGRSEAYEEGILMIRALEYAKNRGTLNEFLLNINKTISPMVML